MWFTSILVIYLFVLTQSWLYLLNCTVVFTWSCRQTKQRDRRTDKQTDKHRVLLHNLLAEDSHCNNNIQSCSAWFRQQWNCRERSNWNRMLWRSYKIFSWLTFSECRSDFPTSESAVPWLALHSFPVIRLSPVKFRVGRRSHQLWSVCISYELL